MPEHITITNTTLRTASNVPYRKVNGYPTFDITPTRITAVDKVAIEGTDMNRFILDIFPRPTFGGDGVRIKPENAVMPGTQLRAQRISAAPLNADRPARVFLAEHPGAPPGTYENLYILTIDYDSDDQDDDDFFTHSVQTGGQFLTIQGHNTELNDLDVNSRAPVGEGSSGTTLQNKDANASIMWYIPTVEFSLKWRRVLNPKWSEIIKRLGHVNNADLPIWEPGWIDSPEAEKAPPETVLFVGVSGSRVYDWREAEEEGEIPERYLLWDLDFRFSMKQVTEETGANSRIYGWNHIYVPRAAKWMKMLKANGDPPYQLFNMNTIFFPEEREDNA